MEVLDFIHELVREHAHVRTSERWWVHPDRYRKELDWLLRASQLIGNECIFSVGCGPAFHEITLAQFFPRMEILATDVAQEEVAIAQTIARSLKLDNIYFETIDAAHIDAISDPRPFDRIISLAALHNVADMNEACKGIARRLKPSGKFIFTYNPYRDRAQFPNRRPLEEILEKTFDIVDRSTLITPEDSLRYYGSLELASREERGYGIVQEARVARRRF